MYAAEGKADLALRSCGAILAVNADEEAFDRWNIIGADEDDTLCQAGQETGGP
ncbi:MAG: hypothetical protein U0231_16505 [Nitrospiraceae bacterium]